MWNGDPKRINWLVFCLSGAALAFLLILSSTSGFGGSVSGTVVDPEGVVSGALIRIRASEEATFSDAAGWFNLGGLAEGMPVEVTAWANGRYITSQIVTPTVSGITLTLRAYHTADHPDYVWTSPISGTSAKACGNCHPMIVDQWEGNAHGTAVTNGRFFSLYNGSDLSGTQAVPPGYLQDFPGTAGSCASCHAPGLGVDGYLTTDMNAARGVITAGIHCDYCHKVETVYLEPQSGMVYPNTPGVEGQRLLRPPVGEDIFFGPFADIPDPDTYAPIYAESAYCASCHQFSFWGTPIYESYAEWLASPYAAAGVTCQDCHMPPNGDVVFALPAQGGLVHPAETIPSHQQLGVGQAAFMREGVELAVDVVQVADRLRVTVTITNSGAGHHFPTDFPGRQLILGVTAVDDGQHPLPLLSGPIVPQWGGAQSGQPGVIYAKVLADIGSGEMPVVSYWKPTRIVSDNRLPALGSAQSVYIFQLVGDEEISLKAGLLFRRAWADLQAAKGWDNSDVVLAETQHELEPAPVWRQYLPLAVIE